MSDHQHEIGASSSVGVMLALVFALVPEAVLDGLAKILMAMLIAASTAITHFWTMRLMKKLAPDKKP
jgi:hypothetical protein